MNLSVNFIERRDPETGSIETVFREVGNALKKRGIDVRYQKLPFGNDAFGMLRNLAAFRPIPADIYHITGHAHYIALRLPARNTVLTIHDLAILRARSGIRRRALKQILFDLPVGRLKFVTAISQNTKRELIEETGCEPSKIRVIADPLRASFRPASKKFNAAEPVLLHIGTAPHKNLEKLVLALDGLECRLVIVGPLSSDQTALLDKQRIVYENRERLTEEDMYNAYINADIVVFCSTHEGFGLPVIEAQAAGVPLVTSNIPPMSEIAGAGAILADPHDAASIRAEIDKLLTDSELREQSIAAGLENVRRFDVSAIAGEYMELYRDVISAIR